MQCTLKRCQGKRGCLCPTGKVPVGTYAGRKVVTAQSSPDDLQLPAVSSVKAPSPTKTALLKQSSIVKVKTKVNKELTQLPVIVSNSSPTKQVVTCDPAEALTSTNQSISGEDLSYMNGENGEVMIRYNHYKKKFPITKGSTTSAVVDAEYYLSFAFPNSKIHITTYGPSDFSFEEQGLTSRPILKENPEGTYWGLDPSKEYWVEIEEDAAERRAYEERQEALARENALKRAEEEANGNPNDMIIKSKTESCSCIEGNPCLDRYACKDWEHRYDVAKRNGWKGFQ